MTNEYLILLTTIGVGAAAFGIFKLVEWLDP